MVNPAQTPLNKNNSYWYTPPETIALVKQVFNGTIDLDPASDTTGQKTVQATKYYDPQKNGLAQAWNADTVFLNPPYSYTADWMQKAVYEFTKKNFQRAIVLTNANTDPVWFHEIASKSSLLCFRKGRIKFLDQNGVPQNQPVKANVFYYLDQNQNPQQFESVFKNIGIIVEPK